jgi:hypothetical protein
MQQPWPLMEEGVWLIYDHLYLYYPNRLIQMPRIPPRLLVVNAHWQKMHYHVSTVIVSAFVVVRRHRRHY